MGEAMWYKREFIGENRVRYPVTLGVVDVRSHRQKIDTFEGGWTKNRHFMGVRTVPEALLSINKRGPVYVHKNSF
eukprot:SAG25_NODE_37_length_19691_cov_19.319467_8_plen_75_part_00